MRIAVMGAGSIGGYFGGMLARGGNEGSLIARGAHLQAIREGGLKVITDAGDFSVGCHSTDDPAKVGSVELALLTVKTYQNGEALSAMKPLVGPHTSVLCLQNGIDSYQQAAEALGEERVLPGAAYIEASLPQPGVVRQTGSVVRIAFGEANGSQSERGELIRNTLEQSGIPAQFTEDIRQTLWTKFLFIATMAGVTSVSRETMADLMPRPEWRRVVLACMEEIETVGRASGVNLPSDVIASTVAYIEGSLDQMHASMHADVMAGRPLELEALNGAAVRAGRATGTATPINDVIYALLKPFAQGTGD